MRLALTNLGSKLSSTDIRQTQLVARTNVFRLRKNLMTAVCYDLLGWGGKNISKLDISNLKMLSSDSFAKFCYICSQIDSQRSINPLLVSKVSRVYSKGKWTNNSWGFKACDVLCIFVDVSENVRKACINDSSLHLINYLLAKRWSQQMMIIYEIFIWNNSSGGRR